MKKMKLFGLPMALIMGLGFTSCEEDESLLAVDDDITDLELIVTEGGTASSTTVYVDDLEAGATQVEVVVKFTSTSKKMNRLYITENIAGAGAEMYELDIEELEKKADGSVDLGSEEEYSFTYSIPFPVLSEMKNGTVEYQLWATSGRGDYRDPQKRLVAGPGIITVNYGGVNPTNIAVNKYSAKLLSAPLADATSETFISVLDGKIYKLSDGEEYASFWDFGYYYTTHAALASTSAYPALFNHDNDNSTPTVAIATLTNTPQEELNNFYFAESAMSVSDFDGITYSKDLNVLTVSDADAEVIKNLSVNDIIEFIDNYGKKGLIKVVEIEPGYGSGDYIKLDIKVQP
jgi:hypothetical protein